MSEKNESETLALMLANCAVDCGYEDAYDAIGAMAGEMIENFYPDVELTEADINRLHSAYVAILEDYADDANELLNEWSENAREEQEVREDALRGAAYGTC